MHNVVNCFEGNNVTRNVWYSYDLFLNFPLVLALWNYEVCNIIYVKLPDSNNLSLLTSFLIARTFMEINSYI